MAEATKVGFQLASSLASKHLTDAEFIKGGYLVVDTVDSMNALPKATTTDDGIIIKGSLCYVTNEAKFYQYNGTTWINLDRATLPYIEASSSMTVLDLYNTIPLIKFEDSEKDELTEITVKRCMLNVYASRAEYDVSFFGLCEITCTPSNTAASLAAAIFDIKLTSLGSYQYEYSISNVIASKSLFTLFYTNKIGPNLCLTLQDNSISDHISLVNNKGVENTISIPATDTSYAWNLPEKTGSIALTSDLPYVTVNHESLENNSINNILSYIYGNHTASFVQNSKVSCLVNRHTIYNFNNIFSNNWVINKIYLLTGAKSNITVQSENGTLNELVNLDQLSTLNLIETGGTVEKHYATGLAYSLKGFGNDSYYGIDYTNNCPIISTEDLSIGITAIAKAPNSGDDDRSISWFYFPDLTDHGYEATIATEQYVQDYVENNSPKIEIVDLTA